MIVEDAVGANVTGMPSPRVSRLTPNIVATLASTRGHYPGESLATRGRRRGRSLVVAKILDSGWQL